MKIRVKLEKFGGMRLWLQQALRELQAGSTSSFSMSLMYSCRLEKLPEALQSKFVELNQDEETTAFIDNCTTSNLFTLAAHRVLTSIISVTDTNAWLGGGRMHVLSTAQAKQLLPISPLRAGAPRRLLDVGSGDGHVTLKLAPLFDSVTATEVSPGMIARLRTLNFNAIQTGDLESCKELMNEQFEVVSLLNVLDRCDKPMTLLRQLRRFIHPDGGLLLIALVLPFKPFVEDGPNQRQPQERLGITSRAWEEAVGQLVQNVLVPAGYTVQSLARVPYLSERYTATLKPYCWLDDVIVVASPAASPSSPNTDDSN